MFSDFPRGALHLLLVPCACGGSWNEKRKTVIFNPNAKVSMKSVYSDNIFYEKKMSYLRSCLEVGRTCLHFYWSTSNEKKALLPPKPIYIDNNLIFWIQSYSEQVKREGEHAGREKEGQEEGREGERAERRERHADILSSRN